MAETGAKSKTAQGLCKPVGETQSSGCPLTRLMSCSKTVVALALFLSLNFFVIRQLPMLSGEHKLDKCWAGWAVDEFRKSDTRPNVVFLGSSLMLVPLAGNDANYLNKKLDGSKHHICQYFEDNFAKRVGYKTKTYNLALPGEMPSDAYYITNFLLKDDKQPDVIVYGVGPRDFMDNLLPSPSATDPFRVLKNLGSIDKTVALSMPDWQVRLDYELGKYIPFYGQREELTKDVANASANWLNKFAPAPKGTKEFTVFDRRQLLPTYHAGELEPGEAFFRPETPAEKKHGIYDNLAEYRKRYKELKWDTFLTQMQFFANFLNVAKERHIHVVVMAMPITQVNRSLLSDYAWTAYLNSIKTLAQAKGASFVDLHNSGAFVLADFMDTVHLSPDGGKKMLDYLVEDIRTDATTLSYLKTKQIDDAEVATAKSKGRQL